VSEVANAGRCGFGVVVSLIGIGDCVGHALTYMLGDGAAMD
jgi:hypothetical protein